MSEDLGRAQRRRRKLVIVLFGALVAIGGTIATNMYQTTLENALAHATEEAADLQYWAKRDSDFVQEARHDDQIATVLQTFRDRSGARMEEALNASHATFSLYKADLELRDRVIKGVNRRTAMARAHPLASCAPIPSVPTPSADESSYYVALGDAADRKREALGAIWACYAARLDRATTDENLIIDDLKRRIAHTQVFATLLQLSGIGIAFMKDVFD